MVYKINNTTLFLQPEKGRWIDRQALGMDGAGHPVFASPREFELSWSLMDSSGLYQLQNFYNLMGNTGTISATLPQYATPPYGYHDYSGCTMSEPTVCFFYEEHYTDVKLIIYKILG